MLIYEFITGLEQTASKTAVSVIIVTFHFPNVQNVDGRSWLVVSFQ